MLPGGGKDGMVKGVVVLVELVVLVEVSPEPTDATGGAGGPEQLMRVGVPPHLLGDKLVVMYENT